VRRPSIGQRRFLVIESVILAALLAAWECFSHGRLTAEDWSGFLLAATPLAIAAMVQTVPILAGGQGLAAGATALLVDVVVGIAPIDGPGSALLWIAIGILIGAAVGLANGLLIGYLRVPSTAVTYATGAAAGALAFLFAGSDGALQQPQVLADLLFGPQLHGLPIVPVLLVAAMVMGGVLMQRSRFGRALSVTGARLPLAERHLPAARLRCLAYVLAGIGYAVAGIVLAGQVGVLDSMLAMPILLQIFAASCLGGSCAGLRAGGAPGAMLGAAIVTATANLFIPLGLPDILSPAFDAAWLLLGLALCVGFADRGRRAETTALTQAGTTGRIWIAATGAAALLALTLLRPDAATIATIGFGLGLLTIGQGAVIRSGGFDLSMPALVSFAGVAMVTISQGSPARTVVAATGILAAASLLGLWHAWLAKRLGRGIILATLATAGVLQAVAAGMTIWLPTGFVPLGLTALASRSWLGLPLPVWVLLPVGLLSSLGLDRAWWSGRRDPLLAYLTSAWAAALFGMLTACIGGTFRLGIVDTSMIPAVAAAVIGGIHFARKNGSVLAALGAALMLQVVDTLLVTLGLGYEVRLMAIAAAMLAAALLPPPDIVGRKTVVLLA
jgi:ribose transport system permease protein